MTAARDALDASQTGAEDLISQVEALGSDLQRVKDAYLADESFLGRWMFPSSWRISQFICNLFPPGPFVEDQFFAYVRLEEVAQEWRRTRPGLANSCYY